MPDSPEQVARVAEHVLQDLLMKCAKDVGAAVMLSAMLVDDPRDRGVIATGGASGALGVALRFLFDELNYTGADNPSAEEAVDALWEIIRPLAIEGLRQRLQEQTNVR